MEQREIESILVADCGRIRTKVTLIDLVEGRYRFLAQGEAPGPGVSGEEDLILSVRGATGQIEEITGRRLLDDEGWPIIPERDTGAGVDAFVATASAAPPLRTLLAGLAHDLSVESAREAIESTYAVVEEVVALDRGLRLRDETICPEAIVIVGGTDGGAISPLLDLTRLVAPLISSTVSDSTDDRRSRSSISQADPGLHPRERLSEPVLGVAEPLAEGSAESDGPTSSDEIRPTVIFAGNAEARLQVARLIGGEADLRIVDNIRPSLEVENASPLQEEMEEVYWERKMRRMPGFARLRAWTSVSIPPAARAFAAVVRFLARRHDLTVAAVDLGGGATTVVLADGSHFVRAMMTNTQGGVEARDVLSPVWERARRKWNPDGGLTPHLDLIIGSGGALTPNLSSGQAALILLDVLQPCGVTNLALDPASLMPSLGALVACHPLAATQVLDRGCLLRLGPVIAPLGRARPGDLVLQLKMHRDDGSTEDIRVTYGAIQVIPLPPGRTARLELRPTRHFDVGLGVKGRGAVTEVEGGLLGLIIDARGRPLGLPSEEERREWLAAMEAPVMMKR
ncbi:MAG TPA: hypothetical protein EYP55_05570 [Anaerolineae bacterium]|nr:hypothetical protein [Anaerolineae bacterium]